MALYDVPAPAKINLFLHVTGRRPDGYHLLQTAFRFVGLYDWLDFDLRRDGAIARDATGQDSALQVLPAEQDLVVKAARALQRATGTRLGAQIRYRKHIPSGGGLGGGSSDAATTLIALNRLWNTRLDRDALMRLALPLGADVPVFVHGQAAFAQGIGEQLTPVALPDRAYLIVQPAATVPTASVFTDPDLTRNTPLVTISVFADWQTVNATQDRAQAGYFGRNDLEPVVFARYPRVGAAAAWLAQQGVKARMTGSGACLFAEFASLQQAGMYRQKIIGKMSSCSSDGTAAIQNAWACPGLNDHPLRHWL